MGSSQVSAVVGAGGVSEVGNVSTSKNHRVCFVLQVSPDRVDEYRRLHEDVWPEMRAALRHAGGHRYSLFLRDDGLLVGYLETDDFAAAQAAMSVADVNARWQAVVSPLFQGLEGAAPDESMVALSEVFHLD